MRFRVLFSITFLTLFQRVSGADFPAVQVVPLPHSEFAFEIGGNEVARYRDGVDGPKPYMFPVLGPSGNHVTAMAHPVDPEGHRHHRSVWIGHRDVNGVNFWEESSGGSIIMTRLLASGAAENTAWFRAAHEWHNGDVVILNEARTWTLTTLERGNYALDVKIEFSPANRDVVFGQTPYGLLGVRVAATMSVAAGGGRILNSEGGGDEAGVLGKSARWVDYSGLVAPKMVNGIACFDHRDNPGLPPTWIVRNDGWMCPSFSGNGALTLKMGESHLVQYRLYIHGPNEGPESIETRYGQYSGKE